MQLRRAWTPRHCVFSLELRVSRLTRKQPSWPRSFSKNSGFRSTNDSRHRPLVEGGRQLATRFLAQGGSPRTLAKDLYRLYVAAGYPEELAEWSGFDDWSDMVEGGVILGRIDDADAAVVDAARALVDGRPSKHVPLEVLFEQTPKPQRRFLGLRRRRP